MSSPPYRFTSFDLRSCIEVAKAIHENGGLLSADELAAVMGYKSANNGSFNTRMANTRLFGLISGPSSAIEPTKRALDILHPDYPATAARARLDAFTSVPLYAAVLEQYHGQPLPDEIGLRNALTTRWSINADKAQMVLARLMDSAEEAGLFDTTKDRSRMIRPTISEAPQVDGPPSAASQGDQPSPLPPPPPPARPPGVLQHKLIDGMLDLLPNERKWTEAKLQQWLALWGDALRLYYELPAPSDDSRDGAQVAARLPIVEGGGR